MEMTEGKKEGVPAYLTVYLALVMSLLLSFCLALIEGVRSNAIRLEAECVADVAMNSVLAEYHRELFRRYNLFAIDSSYGTPYSSKSNTEYHLQKYIERNLSTEDIFLSDFLYKDFLAMSLDEDIGVEVTRVSILTDGNGAVFRQRAVDAVKNDIGLTLFEDLMDWTDTVTAQGLRDMDLEAQKREIDAQIEAFDGTEVQISEQEWLTVDVINPTENLNQIRSRGILETVIENPQELSRKSIVPDTLVAERMRQGSVNSGNVPVQELSAGEKVLEQFFFQEYLLRYMGRYGQVRENAALDYQIEYLIAGKDNDIENLKSVADTLCVLREAANVIYLFTDGEKSAEAEALGTLLATLIHLPVLAPLFKIVLILGWAYAESVHDVEVLLAGGKIPLMKTDETWYYSLESALVLGDNQEENSEQTGLSYEDYLRIFMMFTDLDTLTARAMNMVEADIRLTAGNSSFRMDGCYDGIEAYIPITSTHGYFYEITRKKYYSLY